MKVLVTGGAGFIGANLCRALVRCGTEVVVLDDLSTGSAENLDGMDIDLRVASILDPEPLEDACAEVSSIVHLAARPSVPKSIADPRRSHDANATGTLSVLEAARALGKHVVVSSSSSVYGNGTTLPKHEGMACSPASPYAVSKLAAESYALAYQRCYDLRCTVFRFFNVFGPLQAPGHAYAAVVPAFVWAALHGQPIQVYGDGEQSRDFTFVDSVTDVLGRCVARRVSHDAPVNLAFGTRTTINALIDVLSGLFGRRLDVDRQPARPGDVRHSQAANDSLTRLFPAASPVPLEEGLSRTITWMEETMRSPEFTGVPA
jgi:UDP-glucose 4-epimerase